MAEKKTFTFQGIMTDLKAGNYAPVYILMGQEAYFIDKIADYIADNALMPEERDFNLTVVFGADVNAGVVADMARRFPMMAERQVVIVKEAQNIKNWDRLEQYVDKPQKSTVLVICHKNGTIDGRKKIVAKASQIGVVFESKKKKDYELPPFIEGYLTTHGNIGIDKKSAVMIADHIGADLSRLTSELDKVIFSLTSTGQNRITPEVVEELIGVSKDFNVFELRTAIAKKDIYKANLIVDYFDKNPSTGSAFVLIPQLFSFFQNMLIAYYAPNRFNPDEVARWLDLRGGWAARDYVDAMKNYSGGKVLQIISKIRETDAKSKGLDNPNTPVGELVKELLAFIFH